MNYGSLHAKVKRLRGSANNYPCADCGTTDKKRQWSNASHGYLGVDDFLARCVSCHKKYDNEHRRKLK